MYIGLVVVKGSSFTASAALWSPWDCPARGFQKELFCRGSAAEASYQELPNLAMESLAYAVHLEKHYGHFGKYTPLLFRAFKSL